MLLSYAETAVSNVTGAVRVVRADASRWDDLCGLFGPAGASHGCWCQYWLLGPDYFRRDADLNKDALREAFLEAPAPAPGLVAYRTGDKAVGCGRLCRRSDLGWLNTRFAKHLPAGGDDVWSMSCFFVPWRESRAGVGHEQKRFDESRARPSELAGIADTMPTGRVLAQGSSVSSASLSREARSMPAVVARARANRFSSVNCDQS